MPQIFSQGPASPTPAPALVRRAFAPWILAILLVATLPALSSAQTGGILDGTDPFDLSSQDAFPQFSYYRVSRVDMRLCPSPSCGGVFVEWVNRRVAKCADGSRAKECLVSAVDFSALGLSPEEEARLEADFYAKRVLARGELELVDRGFGIKEPTLFVTDAWRGATGAQGKYGRYFGIQSSGIVCITYPCPSFHGYRLNIRRMNWIHRLDLEPSGATPEQIALGFEALSSGQGLIGFGILLPFFGPAGRGNALYSTEFYTKVERGSPTP
jgi:hypothetical protein